MGEPSFGEEFQIAARNGHRGRQPGSLRVSLPSAQVAIPVKFLLFWQRFKPFSGCRHHKSSTAIFVQLEFVESFK